MGHSLNLTNAEWLCDLGISHEHVEELISMYFRGPDRIFNICVGPPPIQRPGSVFAGYHFWEGIRPDAHNIWLNPSGIMEFDRLRISLGGNKLHLDITHGTCMTLVHELQHANQAVSMMFGAKLVQKGPYLNQAAEKDSRRAADEAYFELAAFLGMDVPSSANIPTVPNEEEFNEVSSIASAFDGAVLVSVRDLVEELRHSGINNSKNVELLRGILGEMGVGVV